MRKLLLLLCLFFHFHISFSQEPGVIDTNAISTMSLEDLMKIKSSGISTKMEALVNTMIEAASKKPLSARKSPAIVSVITQEEIIKSGARDLIDVMRLIPGFDFGLDVWGILGLGVRGNWAHEGKVLLLLDGQEMNEILFSSNQFGNHYSVQQIKRIEIIRGPGSAIYGGFAEYAVINIITKSAEDLNGMQVSAMYGQMEKDFARRNVNLSIGKKIKDFSFSIQAFAGQGNRSDRDFTDLNGTTFSMRGNSIQNPFNVNVGIAYKELSFRYIGDRYNTNARTLTGYDAGRAFPDNFTSDLFELKYVYKVNKKLTITPKINYKRQIPWATIIDQKDSLDSVMFGYKVSERLRAQIVTSYDINKHINIISGAEGFFDKSVVGKDYDYTYANGTNKVQYQNYSGFVQGLFKYHIANFTIGARYDKNNTYGYAFVPRIGITKKFNHLNLKLLYSNSFRAPSIENIEYAYKGVIGPEKSQVIEAEFGYLLSRDSYLSVNIFDITTRNTIIYYNNPNDTVYMEGYSNRGQTGSQGIEAEYKLKQKFGYINLAYSFYTTAYKQSVADYEVPGVNNMLLAFPAHKLALNSSFDIGESFSINPSAQWQSERYGYNGVDSLGEFILDKFKPLLLLNINLRYENLFTKGLHVDVGCYDLLNQTPAFIQPYNSGHPPLPGPSRELTVRIIYNLNFTKK